LRGIRAPKLALMTGGPAFAALPLPLLASAAPLPDFPQAASERAVTKQIAIAVVWRDRDGQRTEIFMNVPAARTPREEAYPHFADNLHANCDPRFLTGGVDVNESVAQTVQ
jgi:hypothetical protein